MPTLLGFVLDKLASFQVLPDRFAIVKEQLIKELRNTRYQQPYHQALYAASVLLEHRRWHVDEYLGVLPTLTAEHVQQGFAHVFTRATLNAYATGNLDAARATALLDQVRTALWAPKGPVVRGLFAAEEPERRVVQVPRGRPLLISEAGSNEANTNSAVIVLFQVARVYTASWHVCQHHTRLVRTTCIPSCCWICLYTSPSVTHFISCGQWSSWVTS